MNIYISKNKFYIGLMIYCFLQSTWLQKQVCDMQETLTVGLTGGLKGIGKELQVKEGAQGRGKELTDESSQTSLTFILRRF